MDSSLLAHVNGSGPSGAMAALALADAGWQVIVRDPLPPQRLLQRSRAYAFTHSSRHLLQRLGLWESLRPHLQPFTPLQLHDEGVGTGVTFIPADLGRRLATDPEAAIGWIGLHRPLMEVLLQAMEQNPSIQLRIGPATTPDPAGASLGSGPADLVVAADGADSPTREALGIGQWCWPYRQACLTVQVQLRGAGEQEAWELLRPEGPFGVLPLGDRRYQLVWSASRGRCRQLESLPDAAFLDALSGVLPDQLQPDALLDDPRAFPVALVLAHRLHRGNTVLLGETAHRCHPVGGQGLNLCWRDVAVLHRLALRAARGRLAPGRLGAAYARRRWPDLLLTLLITDGIVRLTSNRNPQLLPLRRLAVLLLQRQPILRRLLLANMTHGACGLRQGRGNCGDGDHHWLPALSEQRARPDQRHGRLPAASARHQ